MRSGDSYVFGLYINNSVIWEGCSHNSTVMYNRGTVMLKAVTD